MERKILIAEDDVDTCRLIMIWCTRLGFTPIAAPDGEEALERARQERPTVLVTDIMMPKKDGIALIHDVRADPKLGLMKIVVLTGMQAFNRTSVEHLVDKILLKPTTFRQFKEAVEGLRA